jgi:NADH dehydrogenase FAD-containing subunit
LNGEILFLLFKNFLSILHFKLAPLSNIITFITITIGVQENAFFMKEVDDGVKVQKRILERLEAASAILSAREREDAHNQDPDPSKKRGLEEYARLSPAQRVIVNNRKAKRSADKTTDEAEISRLLHWVVVGAGPTGVELCAEMSDFVKYVIP